MKLQFFIFFLFLIPVCASGQLFSRHVYILSEHFSQEKCEISAPCDCCASELIFLSKKKFTLIDRCIDHDTYLTGRYTVQNNLLTLTFKPVVIDNTYDGNKKQEFVEKKKAIMDPLVLQIHSCGDNKTILKHPAIREYKYGSRSSNRKDREIIASLKKSKAWKKL